VAPRKSLPARSGRSGRCGATPIPAPSSGLAAWCVLRPQWIRSRGAPGQIERPKDRRRPHGAATGLIRRVGRSVLRHPPIRTGAGSRPAVAISGPHGFRRRGESPSRPPACLRRMT
jgi:hypothetical protein